jgi:hypothetical protein
MMGALLEFQRTVVYRVDDDYGPYRVQNDGQRPFILCPDDHKQLEKILHEPGSVEWEGCHWISKVTYGWSALRLNYACMEFCYYDDETYEELIREASAKHPELVFYLRYKGESDRVAGSISFFAGRVKHKARIRFKTITDCLDDCMIRDGAIRRDKLLENLVIFPPLDDKRFKNPE